MTSLFNVTLWNLCIAYGLDCICRSGRSAILAYTMPLWVVLLSRLVLNERLTRRRMLGVSLGMAAMALLIGSELAVLRAAPVGAALIGRSGAVLGGGHRAHEALPDRTCRPSRSPPGSCCSAALPIAIGALLLEDRALAQMPGPATFAVWYNIVVAFVFCYWAWYKIVSRTSARRVRARHADDPGGGRVQQHAGPRRAALLAGVRSRWFWSWRPLRPIVVPGRKTSSDRISDPGVVALPPS